MHRRFILLLLLLVALPLAAQTRHLVSRIEVVGDVPKGIVTTQSALAEGQSYSDRDLEIAVGRLRRLPFVYDARYTIDGETLVLEVTAVSRLSADVHADGTRLHDDDHGNTEVGGVGRLFLGSNGVARGRVGGHFTSGNEAAILDAEYAHYGIAGTRLFAIAGISQSFHNDRRLDADPTWRLTVGYPLTLRQSLRAIAAGEKFTSTRTLPILDRSVDSFADRQTFGLEWRFDTTEDPYFARRGEAVSLSPSWTNEDSLFHSLSIFVPDGPINVLTTRTDGAITALGLDATKYWSVGSRGAIVSSIASTLENRNIDYRNGDSEVRRADVDTITSVVSLGYALNLFDWSAPVNSARQRLEFGVAASRRQISQSDTSNATINQQSATIGYALRKQFATVRLNFSYIID
jgi:hypothetical protein